jgi:hypothetical protein
VEISSKQFMTTFFSAFQINYSTIILSYKMYLILPFKSLLKIQRINKQQQVKLIHTEIPLLLVTGSASCAAETFSLSVSMLLKLYDPRK